jgi:hypothetical protein
LRHRATAVPLALHGVWPIVLMTGSSYRAEARFIASLMPVLIAAGILGWVALLETRRPARQAAPSMIPVIAIVVTVFAASARAGELTERKMYRYRYAPEEGQFIEKASNALARGVPALVILPADGEVAPALRLFLRMRMPDVAPDDVFVVKGDPSELARRAQRFGRGVVAFEKGWDHPPDLVTLGEVPLPQGGGRSLLITERRSPPP